MESSSDPPIPPTTHPDPAPAAIDEKERSEKEHEVNTSADLVAGWLGGAGKLFLLPCLPVQELGRDRSEGRSQKRRNTRLQRTRREGDNRSSSSIHE